MGRPYAVAASASVELAVVGPTRRVTVVAATPHALYLTVSDDEATVLAVTSSEAVRVPCALVLEPKTMPVQPPAGTVGHVGAGTLGIAGTSYRAARWWRPPRPRGLGAVPPARLAAAARWLSGRVADPLDSAGRAAVADLLHQLTSCGLPLGAVARLLGRGPGLTPTGDDVLAGALVCLTALGAPAAAPLAAAVRGIAPGATTTVSAALLRHATRGECIPQLADLLDAVAGTGSQAVAGALPRSAGALLAVGNCSGAGLLHGVLVAVAIAHPRIADDALPNSWRPAAVA
jgi:Protein of unknown function (DUF2877)